jgi:hypothetical protein
MNLKTGKQLSEQSFITKAVIASNPRVLYIRRRFTALQAYKLLTHGNANKSKVRDEEGKYLRWKCGLFQSAWRKPQRIQRISTKVFRFVNLKLNGVHIVFFF